MGEKRIRTIMRQNSDKKSINPIVVFFAFLLGAVTAFAAFWRMKVSKGKKGTKVSDTVDRDYEAADREMKHLLGVLRRENERRMWGDPEIRISGDYGVSGTNPAYIQTAQVKPYRPRKRVSAKKIFGRAVAAAVAVALVVTGLRMVPSDVAPASTVLAKESFGGMKQVVEDHDEDNPFVILDIVPGKASAVLDGKKYDFSLGTIGYLAPGQSPIQQDLFSIFTGDDKKSFYGYTKRIELTNLVIGGGDSGLVYQEAYGGTGEDLRASMWSKIFDPESDGSTPTGRLKARVEKGSGEEFEYNLKDGEFSASTINLLPADGIYTFAKDTGNYHVTFGDPVRARSGYQPVELASGSIDSLDYSPVTGVYIVQDGEYRYVGKIKDVMGNVEEEPEEEETSETIQPEEKVDEEPETPPVVLEQPTETPADDTPETPGDDTPETPPGDDTPADDTPETAVTPTETEVILEQTSAPASESLDVTFRTQSVLETAGMTGRWYLCLGETPTTEEETPITPIEPETPVVTDPPEEEKPETTVTTTEPKQPQSEMPAEGTYCVLAFEYVEYADERLLYQIRPDDGIEQISTEGGEAHPYDSYVLESDMLSNSLYAVRETDTLEDEPTPKGTFTYVGPGKGEYKLTRVRSMESAAAMSSAEALDAEQQDENSEDAGVQENSARDAMVSGNVYDVEVLNAPVYIRCTGGNDYLRRYVFNSLKSQDNASDNFAIRVDTVLAGDVTYEMVQEADLVYLEDGEGEHLNLNGNATKSYIYTKAVGNAEDGLADISGEVITRLLYEAVAELKPVIVDYGIIESENYPDADYQKLAKAFLKKDLTAFYYDMAKSNDLAGSVLMNVDNDSFPNKTDNDYHYVNRNVYIVNGTPLVGDDFPEEMSKDEAKAGFSEVLALIRAENVVLPEDEKISEKISKAMAVQYIINYSLGLVGEYKDLSILELQPTANMDSDLHRDVNEDKGSVVLYWQREDQDGEGQQILRSSKIIETNVTISSVAAFNSSYQDINADYNMIFIGLDGQRLYRDWDEDGMLSAVYNDDDLNGKVYHTGDRVADSDARYDANDITEKKKEELLDYLRAGYPIVVENECFKDRSARNARERDINTKYIASDTQMYAFLKEAISLEQSDDDDESGIGIYTIEDVHSSALFAMQLNAQRPKIELRERDENAGDNGENASGEMQIPSGMIDAVSVPEMPGILRGTIDYRITSDRTGEDKTYMGSLERHLYLDLNYDGVYAPEEEFAGYQYEDMEGGGRISVDFNEINFGIVPWKLEVTDADNKYRRAATQGCFTISGGEKAKIRVLQVLDDTSNDYANLQEQYENIENSMLAHYMKGAEALLKMNWKIETVTPSVLTDRLTKNANYLSLWDVVVLGFGESGNPGDTVTAAVNEYITAGGSVLISSAGASSDQGRLGIPAAVLGQKEEQTYGKLGLNSGTKFRYDGISSNMFDKTPALFLDRVNDGTIAKWPYEIGTRAQLGSSTEVSMPDYLLDIGTAQDAGQPYATAWFTLLDLNLSKGGYSVSPRDGKNNYYVYSKGNVVYVGQTEYKYVYVSDGGITLDGEEGMDECRIFVNALMAAYNAGVHKAQVSIVAGFNGATKVESVTVPYDVAFKEGGDAKGGILGETVDVYFRFTDNNIACDKTTELALYYKNAGAAADTSLLLSDGGINTADYTVFTSTIWAVENNRLVEVTEGIVPGKVYRIKAPLEALQNGDDETSEICVLLTNRYTRAGKSVEALSMDSVSLNRAQMFLLE